MNLRGVTQWLLDNEYGIMVGGKFVITQKFNSELGGWTNDAPPVPFVREAVAIEEPVVTMLTDKKLLWNRFIEDAEVPWRVKAPDGGIYTVRQYSASAVNNLVKIINDPSVNYQRLVESTKEYYKTVTYKKLLSNYLNDGIWKSAYDEYGKNPPVGGSENRWET